MIIGYRTFHLGASEELEPRLVSTASEYVWQPGNNEAEHISGYMSNWCNEIDGVYGHNVAQGHSTHCGFWAYNTPQAARDHGGKRSSNVTVAAVLGWGNYTIGTQGWRCEFAKIIALSHAMWDEMEELSEYYKVPLVTFKGLTEFASHFGVTSEQLDTKYDVALPTLTPYPFASGEMIYQQQSYPVLSYSTMATTTTNQSFYGMPTQLSFTSGIPTWSGKMNEYPQCCNDDMEQFLPFIASFTLPSQCTQLWICKNCVSRYQTINLTPISKTQTT